MTSSFRPVNTPLLSPPPPPPTTMKEDNYNDQAHRDQGYRNQATRLASPATPTPSSALQPQPPDLVDDATTPTRANFNNGTALSSQRPLPTSPFPDSVQVPEHPERKSPGTDNSQHRRKSRDSEDVDMDGSDEEGANGEDGAGSDGESVNADGSQSNKKKKSQRFYCTGHPPCNLSFTRSEHLARHIRKHTGERPFACHCSRRFSRLDNLRQHAQTVHVNEDIPIDSLAASGVGFRRQVRTDRVRQVAGRARASTAGSIGATGRGHSKSLSTSSIASASSIGSNYATNDARRRPPPLVMADPRSRIPVDRMPLDHYRSAADPRYYRQPSPSDFSTPTSATFSTGQTSPRWGSGVASPASSHSRSHSMYVGSRTPGRRLSVPSGGNPFQSPHGPGIARSQFGPGPTGSPHAATFSPGNSSLLSSPTASTHTWSRRDSISSTADEAWRRRTWHPDTRDYNGASRLSQVVTPSQFQPLHPVNPAQQPPQTFRLPGIESFDPIPPHRLTPPRRNASPMMIDSGSPNRPPLTPGEAAAEERRNLTSQWDMGLHRGLTRLDINTPPRDTPSSWANEPPPQAVLAPVENSRPNPAQLTVRFDADVRPPRAAREAPPIPVSRHHHTMSAPLINTPREAKRHGWYHGPLAAHPVGETIPEGRAEGRAHVDRIVHPNVSGFQGFPARDQQPVVHQHPAGPTTGGNGHPNRDPESLRRLEALVAVATSEGSTATAC